MKRIDWRALRQAYLDGAGLAELARRFKVGRSLIEARAEEEGWNRLARTKRRLHLADKWLSAAEAAAGVPADAEKMAKALNALAGALKTLEALEPAASHDDKADPALVSEFNEEVERLVRQRINDRRRGEADSGPD